MQYHSCVAIERFRLAEPFVISRGAKSEVVVVHRAFPAALAQAMANAYPMHAMAKAPKASAPP